MPDFRPSLVKMWKETFEGIPEGADGTWYVQGKEGIFDALETVTAAQASKKPAPASSTIAAHVNHIRFALQMAHSLGGGPKPEGTWESSWDVQEMSEEEWAKAAGDIRSEYEFILNWLETTNEWEDKDTMCYAISLPIHMGFHLGAIRQLMKIV